MSDFGVHAHVRRLPAYRVFWMFWGGLALVDVLASTPTELRLAALAALVAVCVRRASLATALLVAATAWLLANGFVDHTYGQLALDGARSVAEGALLVVVALVARR